MYLYYIIHCTLILNKIHTYIHYKKYLNYNCTIDVNLVFNCQVLNHTDLMYHCGGDEHGILRPDGNTKVSY